MAIANIASGVNDGLESLIARRLFEQMQAAKIQDMQANQQTDRARVGLEGRRVEQGDRTIDQTDRHFNANLGLQKDEFGFRKDVYNDAASARAADLAHTTASTNEILRQPSAEQIARDFTTGRDKTQYGFRLGEINAQGKNALAVANARPEPTTTVQTVDKDGNPITMIVPKTAGASYVKPENATAATRTKSAETVNAVGNDIVNKLSDPKFRAVLGPALGRAGSLQDFIGNPPPEFSELAGQIESYALANMGVHGMRSAEGAKKISDLLSQKHTPESLAATIHGLNDFSERFAASKPRAGGATVPTTQQTGGTVAMIAPDGGELIVPADQVNNMLARGAKKK